MEYENMWSSKDKIFLSKPVGI